MSFIYAEHTLHGKCSCYKLLYFACNLLVLSMYMYIHVCVLCACCMYSVRFFMSVYLQLMLVFKQLKQRFVCGCYVTRRATTAMNSDLSATMASISLQNSSPCLTNLCISSYPLPPCHGARRETKYDSLRVLTYSLFNHRLTLMDALHGTSTIRYRGLLPHQMIVGYIITHQQQRMLLRIPSSRVSWSY